MKSKYNNALEAVTAWLDGDFGLGEEEALVKVIRNDPRITISAEAVEDIVMDEIQEDPPDYDRCMRRLVAGA